jgi:parvulin-like peptidyl-prolyl isomerase
VKSRLSKFVVLASVVASVSLVASACSTVSPDAATVNGDSINRSTFDDQLETYAANDAFLARVSQAGQGAVEGNGDGTVSADFARQVLQREIVLLVVQQENAARGVTVTPEIAAAAREDVIAQFGLEAFDAFPKSFQDTLVDQNAQVFLLRAHVAGNALDDGALQAVFDEDPSQFAEVCAAHILVATKAEAEDVAARLDDGEDFATVAAEVSTDTGSAASGGNLGCVARGVTVPEFEDALFATPEGEISDPVETQFGFHIIEVLQHNAPTFEAAKPLVLQKVLSDSNEGFNTVLNEKLAAADVSIDARYGRWNPSLSLVVADGLHEISNESSATTGG